MVWKAVCSREKTTGAGFAAVGACWRRVWSRGIQVMSWVMKSRCEGLAACVLGMCAWRKKDQTGLTVALHGLPCLAGG